MFEPAIESDSPAEHGVSDEGGGCVARLAECLREGRLPIEARAAVGETDSVLAREA